MALAINDAAIAEFHVIREGFRAGGSVSVDEYLAAKVVFDAAMAEFDAAFAAEEARELAPAAPAAPDDSQLSLF